MRSLTPARAMLLAACALGLAPGAARAQGWQGYGKDAQHSGANNFPSQDPGRVRWHTPVDMNPQYANGGADLYIHYGSPAITRDNTVLLPVKTGQNDGFSLRAFRGYDGAALWSLDTDYSVPPHGWTPSCGPTLTPRDRLVVVPAAGGTVLTRSQPNRANGAVVTRLAFYGINNYNAASSTFDSSVKISTPITADAAGNLYFGFAAAAGAPLGLQSGLARIGVDGTGSYVSATAAAADSGIKKVAYNCAPALSVDGSTVYVAVNDQAGSAYGHGYLLALNSTTLATRSKVRLKDAKTPANDAIVPDDGTASPTVGPDGDVYYGVLENPFYSNNLRGWMLHFSGDLSASKTPGAFGWDDTASVVPASIVASYTGTSNYLILTKYNNYVEGGGDGVNKLALLDPNATQTDAVSGAAGVMKEVLTIAGITPDTNFLAQHPNAVREWCINTAAIDKSNRCAIVNSEDGHLYRWDFTTNTLTGGLPLNGPVGEAYTPTVIGPDGSIYAINNATLYSCVAR